MQVVVVTVADDLLELTNAINAACWDEANELSEYSDDALRVYLERQDTIFIACYETIAERRVLLGIASASIQMKPYGQSLWLYVDEVDVCANHRQRGVGKRLMRKLLEIAEDAGCEELWLGTEVDNDPANALYKSLKPDDAAEVIGYTFETDE